MCINLAEYHVWTCVLHSTVQLVQLHAASILICLWLLMFLLQKAALFDLDHLIVRQVSRF